MKELIEYYASNALFLITIFVARADIQWFLLIVSAFILAAVFFWVMQNWPKLAKK